MRPVVVQMHGEPGSGKSALARAIAPRIGAVVLDKDVIKSALLRAGVDESQSGGAAYEVYFDMARSLVELGHSVILDNPVFWPRVEERWLELSRLAECPPVLIECVCADRDELRRRLATRDGVASQPREPLDLLRHPGAAATAFEPRLTVDTTRRLDEIAEETVAYTAARCATAGATP